MRASILEFLRDARLSFYQVSPGKRRDVGRVQGVFESKAHTGRKLFCIISWGMDVLSYSFTSLAYGSLRAIGFYAGFYLGTHSRRSFVFLSGSVWETERRGVLVRCFRYCDVCR